MRKLKKTRVKNTYSSCRALILVDSTQIRSEEQKKCQKLYEKLEKTRKAVQVHESESVPEFQKWIHSHFSKTIAEITELNYKVEELRTLVDTVESQSFLTGCPPWEAYATIQRFKNKAEEGEKKRESFYQTGNQTGNQSGSQSDDPFGFDETFQKAQVEFNDEELHEFFEFMHGNKKQWRSKTQSYEEAFEAFKTQFDPDYEEPQFKQKKNQSDKQDYRQGSFFSPHEQEKNFHSRLKEQYRILARRLHPDLNPGLEPKQQELWYQVQQAYESENVDRLETLVALSEMFDQKWDQIGKISTLKSLFLELKNTLKQIEKKVRLARKDNSWKFNEKMKDIEELKRLKNLIQKKLHLNLGELKDMYHDLQSLIDSWMHPPKKRKQKTKSRKKMGLNESIFFG